MSKTILDLVDLSRVIPQSTDRIKDFILNLAFEGRLTNDDSKRDWEEGKTLKDFGQMIRGISYAKSDSRKNPAADFIPLLGAANIQQSLNYSNLTYVPSDLVKGHQLILDGDVLICMSSGSKSLVGKAAMVHSSKQASFGAFCAVYRPSNAIDRDFLELFFQSPKYRREISQSSRGIGINNLRIGDIESIQIPLPPLKTQKEIVKAIKEKLSTCDELELRLNLRANLVDSIRQTALKAISTAQSPEELQIAWQRIQQNWEFISGTPESIDDLRGLILTLATKGSLVKQNSSEEPPSFDSVEHNKEIPRNWIWSRLDSIAIYGGNGSINSNSIPKDSWVLDLEDIEKNTSKLLQRSLGADRHSTSNKSPFNAGDVLYGKLRPYLDKVLVADSPGFCTTEIVPIRPKVGLDSNWLRICLKRPEFIKIVTDLSYGTKMPRLGTNDAKSSIHPIPPLEEQKRIVMKVNQLFQICDQLKYALSEKEKSAEKFARSVVSVPV